MTNVVEFTGGGRRNDRDWEKAEAIFSTVRKARLLKLKERFKDRPKMSKPSERAVAARNLYELLETLEAENVVKKAAVAREAGMGGDGLDSTKRLYTYTLPNSLNPDEHARRAKALVQGVRGYRRLAEAAAQLAGREPDAFLEKVFRGTGYDSGDETLPDGVGEPWVAHVCEMLHKMCRWVIRRNKVDEYFSRLKAGDIGVDPDGFAFVDGERWFPLDLDLLQHRDGGSVTAEPDEMGASIPSVLLHTSMEEPSECQFLRVPTPASAARERFVELFLPFLGKPGDPPDECGTVTPCTVQVCKELRLALAPIGSNGLTIPTFEVRFVSTLVDASGTVLGTFEGPHPNSAGDVSAWEVVDVWRVDDLGIGTKLFDVALRTVRREDTPTRSPAPVMNGFRHYREIDLFSTYEELRIVGYGCLANPTESPQGTLAASIEDNLYSAPPETRLDCLLDQNAASLVAMVAELEASRQAALDRCKAETIARWDD